MEKIGEIDIRQIYNNLSKLNEEEQLSLFDITDINNFKEFDNSTRQNTNLDIDQSSILNE